jgi:hypothetical protein
MRRFSRKISLFFSIVLAVLIRSENFLFLNLPIITLKLCPSSKHWFGFDELWTRAEQLGGHLPQAGGLSQQTHRAQETGHEVSDSFIFWALLRNRIRIHIRRIRMFSDLLNPDPDPLFRAWTRIQIRILPSPSKNSFKKPWFLLLCDFFLTFYLWKIM